MLYIFAFVKFVLFSQLLLFGGNLNGLWYFCFCIYFIIVILYCCIFVVDVFSVVAVLYDMPVVFVYILLSCFGVIVILIVFLFYACILVYFVLHIFSG